MMHLPFMISTKQGLKHMWALLPSYPWSQKVPLRLETAGALQVQEHHYTLIEIHIDKLENYSLVSQEM